MWPADNFLAVVTRRHKPYRSTVLVGCGSYGQHTVEETIIQAVHYGLERHYPAVIIANWHQEILDSRVGWISRHVTTFRPTQMLEGAQDGLLGSLDTAEEAQHEWEARLEEWLAKAARHTTHVGGNLTLVCHFLSPGGGHLLVTQVGVEKSYAALR